MEKDIYFPAVAAVSAGGLNAVNYLARQPGRSARINLCYRHDPRYVGPLAVLRNRGVVGFHYLFGSLAEKEPFDYATFNASTQRLVSVATNVNTGRAEYFEKDHRSDFIRAVIASASMPLCSLPVKIDGKPYLDGGCACPIPLDWALEQGYEHIVVVATREKGFRKPVTSQRMVDLYSDFYASHPRFFATLLTMDMRYNALMDRMDQLEEEGRIFVLRPGRPVDVGRFEGNTESCWPSSTRAGRKPGMPCPRWAAIWAWTSEHMPRRHGGTVKTGILHCRAAGLQYSQDKTSRLSRRPAPWQTRSSTRSFPGATKTPPMPGISPAHPI